MDKKRANSGTTMVEVIVAFTVLLLIMGIFSQAVTLTGRMMNRSQDTLVGYRSLAGDYYMDKTTDTSEAVLRFEEVNKGNYFDISATVREFENVDGALYDVVVDTRKSKKNPPSPSESEEAIVPSR